MESVTNAITQAFIMTSIQNLVVFAPMVWVLKIPTTLVCAMIVKFM